MEVVLQWLVTEVPVVAAILTGLGFLVVIVSAYVTLTKTTDDDKWWNKVRSMNIIGDIIRFAERFSPIKPKEKVKAQAETEVKEE